MPEQREGQSAHRYSDQGQTQKKFQNRMRHSVVQVETSRASKFWQRFLRMIHNATHRRLSSVSSCVAELTKIGELCLAENPTAHHMKEGLYRLTNLERKIDEFFLVQLDVNTILGSCLSCFFYFQERLRANGCMDMRRRQLYLTSASVLDQFLKRLIPDLSDEVTQAVMQFINVNHHWNKEFQCKDIFQMTLNHGILGYVVMSAMLNHVDNLMTNNNIMEARLVIRVLYELLDNHNWPQMKANSINTISRLLKMFRASVQPNRKAKFSYAPIRKGLEVCARRAFEHMDNYDLLQFIQMMAEWALDSKMPIESLLDFGNVLEFACIQHTTILYQDTLTSSLLKVILKMISSDSRLVSLLGTRVLQNLFDRNDNLSQFDTPKIFFQHTHFNVIADEYCSEDKTHLRNNRVIIHDSFLKAFVVHGSNRLNLEAIYTAVCLMIAEVPCGYTAAAAVCLMMNIQEAALNPKIGVTEIVTHHLHATILSVMSLICWVHKACDFYNYLNKIMQRRADEAPHLNPPLRSSYTYAHHHVLYYKEELYFENWEVRYGLWMHFRRGAAQPRNGQLGELAGRADKDGLEDANNGETKDNKNNNLSTQRMSESSKLSDVRVRQSSTGKTTSSSV